MVETEKIKSAGRRTKVKRAAKGGVLPWSEVSVWQPITRGWRRLYGGFDDLGVSIEWHDFELHAELDWARSFHPGSLELCLNLAGHGRIDGGDQNLIFVPMTAGFYAPGNNSLRASRFAGARHQFVTVEFSPRFLCAQLSGCDGALHPLVEQVIRGSRNRVGVSEAQRLGADKQHLVARLLQPPVFQAARQFWYQGKVLELMAEFFFERRGEDELFCDRQKRLARERVDKVIALLRANLAGPPDLEGLGRSVGCSPFHLSRTFSAEMEMTIPQFLRKLRMERAAELLGSGKHNVTEAAMEVGYSSLSHFSQAFCQTMGCCPTLYPLKTSVHKAVQG